MAERVSRKDAKIAKTGGQASANSANGRESRKKKAATLAQERGSQSKYTDERGKVILDHIRKGGFLSSGAMLAGLHPDTVRRWKRDGDDQYIPEFADAYLTALGEAIDGKIDEFNRHCKGNVVPVMKYLGCMVPEFRPVDSIDVTTAGEAIPNGSNVVIIKIPDNGREENPDG